MTKLSMLLVCCLGLAVFVSAGVAKFRAESISTAIVGGIAELRQVGNYQVCLEQERKAGRQLAEIQRLFVPIMWLGGAVALVGLLGLVAQARRRAERKKEGESGPH